MPEGVTTGEVEKMQSKQAKNGGEYTAITLKGQKKGFYDWDGHCARAGITAGDTVTIEHDGSGFPRVTGLEKVGSGESTPTDREATEPDKENWIIRMCAVSCAASVLHGSGMTAEQITGLASQLEKWITG